MIYNDQHLFQVFYKSNFLTFVTEITNYTYDLMFPSLLSNTLDLQQTLIKVTQIFVF